MNIMKMNCTACGAPISIPEEVLQITCTSCGTSLLVERGEGYVALKVAEKLSKAIETSGVQTQEVIRENTQVTRTELQRLQLSQELSMTEMQLNGIQSEIRTLERESKNPTAAKQLLILHQNEYPAMERIRSLKMQISDPSPDDLNASLALAEWEHAWVGKEIIALKGSSHPQRSSLISNLTDRQNKLSATMIELKARQLKKQYPSFQLADPPADDGEKLTSLLRILNRDEQESSKDRYTLEGKSVYDEIQRRVKKIQEALHRLDVERISRTLTSLKDQLDWRNPAGLQDHLTRVDQDLQSLLNVDQTEVVREIQKRIIDDRRDTIQQLQALERGVQSVRDPTVAQPAIGTIQRVGVGQIGTGCLLSALILLGFSLIGILIFAFTDRGNTTTWDMLPMFIFTLFGFGLGSRTFLHRIGPKITIKGVAGLRDLVIVPKDPRKTILSQRVIRFFVGLITFIEVLLLFFSISMLLSSDNSTLSALFFLIGILLAPFAAWFIAKRTTITLAD